MESNTRKQPMRVSSELYYENNELIANKFLTLRLTDKEFTRLIDLATSKETTKTAFVKNLIFSLI